MQTHIIFALAVLATACSFNRDHINKRSRIFVIEKPSDLGADVFGGEIKEYQQDTVSFLLRDAGCYTDLDANCFDLPRAPQLVASKTPSPTPSVSPSPLGSPEAEGTPDDEVPAEVPVPTLDAAQDLAEAGEKPIRFVIECTTDVPELAGEYTTVFEVQVADAGAAVEKTKVGSGCATPKVTITVASFTEGIKYRILARHYENPSPRQPEGTKPRLVAYGGSPTFVVQARKLKIRGALTVALTEFVPAPENTFSVGDKVLRVVVQGAPDVEVSLLPIASDIVIAQPVKTKTTDATGAAMLDGLSTGRYVLRVAHANFATKEQIVAFDAAEEAKDLTVLMVPAASDVGTLSVVVKNARGRGLPALVLIESRETPELKRVAFTVKGIAVLTKLPIGTYAVAAQRPQWDVVALPDPTKLTPEDRTKRTFVELRKQR